MTNMVTPINSLKKLESFWATEKGLLVGQVINKMLIGKSPYYTLRNLYNVDRPDVKVEKVILIAKAFLAEFKDDNEAFRICHDFCKQSDCENLPKIILNNPEADENTLASILRFSRSSTAISGEPNSLFNHFSDIRIYREFYENHSYNDLIIDATELTMVFLSGGTAFETKLSSAPLMKAIVAILKSSNVDDSTQNEVNLFLINPARAKAEGTPQELRVGRFALKTQISDYVYITISTVFRGLLEEGISPEMLRSLKIKLSLSLPSAHYILIKYKNNEFYLEYTPYIQETAIESSFTYIFKRAEDSTLYRTFLKSLYDLDKISFIVSFRAFKEKPCIVDDNTFYICKLDSPSKETMHYYLKLDRKPCAGELNENERKAYAIELSKQIVDKLIEDTRTDAAT